MSGSFVGIDVESIYTSIPHHWGLRAVEFFLDKLYREMAHQNEFILDLLNIVLHNNFFLNSAMSAITVCVPTSGNVGGTRRV